MYKKRDLLGALGRRRRIIKAKLPGGVQIGKEAKTAFSKACSIFIMYVTTIANDLCEYHSYPYNCNDLAGDF